MNAKRPDLSGHRVLVTRPLHQQAGWLEGLASAGADSISLPLLAIVPPDDEGDGTLRRLLLALDRFDLLVFVSTNAVQAGVAAIEDYWPQFPCGIDLIAIGPTTAALARQHLGSEVMCAPGGVTSEDLLSSELFINLANKRIGIVRGQGGREVLAQQLKARGAEVDYLEVYRRVRVTYSDAEAAQALNTRRPSVLTAASGESLEALRALIAQTHQIGAAGADRTGEAPLLSLPLVVPSPRVQALGRDLGFTEVINADGAGIESLMKAVSLLPQAKA